jgi:putative cell wall-binding protein
MSNNSVRWGRRGVGRHVVALMLPLMMLLAVTTVVAVPPAKVVSAATLQRVAGEDRYRTSVDVARLVGGGSLTGLDRLIVVTGERFPDGLVASGLAGYLDESGRSGRTAILLTQIESLPGVVAQAITDSGVSAANVVVVGGASAVSEGVHAAIARAAGWSGQGENPVTRIAGETRYETAAAVVDYVTDLAGGRLTDSYRTVLVANGETFPDALAGGALAYRNGHLMVLSRPPVAPQAARDAITDLRANCAVLLGGPVALSTVVGTQVNEELSGQGCGTDRLGGADRYVTATAIANRMRSTVGVPSSVVLTSGTDFADALVAAPLAANNTPILFTSPTGLPAATTGWLQANSGSLTQIQVLGGTAAVPQSVANAAVAAATVSGDDSGGSGGSGEGGDGGGGGGSSPASWSVRAGGTAEDRGNAVATFTDGSAVVVGEFKGTATFGDDEHVNFGNNSNDPNVFVTKLGASGAWLWTATIGGSSEIFGTAVAPLSDGSSIVVGSFWEDVTFYDTVSGSAITMSNGGVSRKQDIYVAKVRHDGKWAWAVKAGGLDSDIAKGISVASASATSAIVTGFIGSSEATFGSLPAVTNLGGSDVFVASVDVATGAWEWVATAGSTTNHYSVGHAVSALPDGSGALVTGEFRGTVTFTPTTSASVTLSTGKTSDVFVARISANGAWEWSTRVNTTMDDDAVGMAIAVLPDGSAAIVTGSVDYSNAFIARVSTDGSGVAWVTELSAFSEGFGVAVASDGLSAVVVGEFRDSATFGSTTISSGGFTDVFCGPGLACRCGVALLPNGSAIVTGDFSDQRRRSDRGR